MGAHLVTERLVLRELTSEDVDLMVALDTDPDVARWSMDPVPSREEVEQRHVMEKAGLRLVREYESSYPPLGPDDVLGDVECAITREEWEQEVGK